MIKRILTKPFESKVDALGLSVFRILYSLVLFLETLQLFKFRHIIYDKDPFQYVGEIDVTFFFFFWFIVLGLLMLGLFTKTATILNYIFAIIIFSSAKHFAYHVYYLYVAVNFLLMFLPISRVFSMDSLVQKLKYTRVGFEYKVDRKVLEINYLIPVFSAIALVYFDSIFQKLSSPMWRSGLGMWLPSSLPMVTLNDTSVLLNQEWLIKFLGYFVVFFEGAFIFLFWFRQIRIPLMIIGILFHIGILIIYPIPLFALTVIAVYILMLPDLYWMKLSQLLKSKYSSYTFYYDAACPICIKAVVVIKHLDVFNKIRCLSVHEGAKIEPALKGIPEEELLINIHGVSKNGKLFKGYDAYSKMFQQLILTYPIALVMKLPGISIVGKKLYRYIAGERLTVRCTEQNCILPQYSAPPLETQNILINGWSKINLTKKFWQFIILFMFLSQCLMMWGSPIIQKRLNPYHKESLKADFFLKKSRLFLRNYFGISHHGVFLNDHFDKNNFIFRTTYFENNREIDVPIINKNGMPERYNYGSMWCYNTYYMFFDMVKHKNDRVQFEKGIVDYLKYFQTEYHIKGDQLKFNIYVKEIETPKQWERDFLKNQIKKPWQIIGIIKLNKGIASFDWSYSRNHYFNSYN
jgi:predicted DCC family thiol-disulfide oxidoreductase YuxK